VKIALAQIQIVPGDPDVNLDAGVRSIGQAAARDAALVVLPEALDCGWTHPSARELAGAIPGGAAFERLKRAAGAAQIYVCAGITERAGECLYNAAVLISPQGELLVHHRKIHELDFARELYSPGDRLSVAQTPLGRIGVMICADAFAAGYPVSRTLGLMGARLIVSPCAWAVPSDHDNASDPYGGLWLECYGAVAKEFGLWVAGASNVGSITAGPWAGRKCIGCSLVIGPDGQPVLWGPYGETAEALLLAEIPDRP
jgi:predicted amidohydrolase